MVKPLTTRQLGETIQSLKTLLAHLEHEEAETVQRLLGEAMRAEGYPTTASGAQTEPENKVDEDGQPVRPDSATERAALTKDREAERARQLITDLGAIDTMAWFVAKRLGLWSPSRAVEVCHVCHHPKERGTLRCQRVGDDGQQCAASKQTRFCKNPNCGDVVPTGDRFPGGRCNRCDVHWRRQRSEYLPAAGLADLSRIEVTQ